MDVNEGKKLVAETGRLLLEKGLVARTWGNISCRLDENTFAVSPSGLDYERITPEDVPVYHTDTKTFEGPHKPSSEKKIHAAAYRCFEDVNFVIHTHQDYATAVSLGEKDGLCMSEEEKRLLGHVVTASYGLPGTKKLKKAVEEAMKAGSKVILMAHHGAVILGKSREETLQKAELLEKVCQRQVLRAFEKYPCRVKKSPLAVGTLASGRMLEVVSDENILAMSLRGGFRAQLDDMAQMTGEKLPAVRNDRHRIIRALKNHDAVLVCGVGCVVAAEREDDAEALKILVKKACMAKRYTLSCGIKNNLSVADCRLMKTVFKLTYAGKKEE